MPKKLRDLIQNPDFTSLPRENKHKLLVRINKNLGVLSPEALDNFIVNAGGVPQPPPLAEIAGPSSVLGQLGETIIPSMQEQYEESTGLVETGQRLRREAGETPDLTTKLWKYPVGLGADVLGQAGQLTSLGAPAFKGIANIAKTAQGYAAMNPEGMMGTLPSVPRTPEQAQAIAASAAENLANIGNLAGPNQPTTGSEVGDIVLEVLSGFSLPAFPVSKALASVARASTKTKVIRIVGEKWGGKAAAEVERRLRNRTEQLLLTTRELPSGEIQYEKGMRVLDPDAFVGPRPPVGEQTVMGQTRIEAALKEARLQGPEEIKALKSAIAKHEGFATLPEKAQEIVKNYPEVKFEVSVASGTPGLTGEKAAIALVEEQRGKPPYLQSPVVRGRRVPGVEKYYKYKKDPLKKTITPEPADLNDPQPASMGMTAVVDEAFEPMGEYSPIYGGRIVSEHDKRFKQRSPGYANDLGAEEVRHATRKNAEVVRDGLKILTDEAKTPGAKRGLLRQVEEVEDFIKETKHAEMEDAEFEAILNNSLLKNEEFAEKHQQVLAATENAGIPKPVPPPPFDKVFRSEVSRANYGRRLLAQAQKNMPPGFDEADLAQYTQILLGPGRTAPRTIQEHQKLMKWFGEQKADLYPVDFPEANWGPTDPGSDALGRLGGVTRLADMDVSRLFKLLPGRLTKLLPNIEIKSIIGTRAKPGVLRAGSRDIEKNMVASIRTVMRHQGRHGQKIMNLIDETFLRSELRAGEVKGEFYKLAKGLTKKDRKEVFRVMDGQVDEKGRLYRTTNSRVQKVVDFLDDTNRKIHAEAAARGLKVTAVKDGRPVRVVPFSEINVPVHHFPRFIKRDKITRKDNLERSIAALMKEDPTLTEEAAARLVKNYVNRHSVNRFGNLEMARELNVPKEFYENDAIVAFNHYFDRSFRRLEEARHYGADNKILDGLVNQADLAGADRVWMDKALESVIKGAKSISGSDAIVKTTQHIRGAELVSKMGLSAAIQPTQATAIALRTTTKDMVMGLAELLKGRATYHLSLHTRPDSAREFAIRAGATVEGGMSETLDMVGATGSISSNYMKSVGFNLAERGMRTWASVAGRRYAISLGRQLVKKPKDVWIREELSRMNILPDQVLEQRGVLTEEQTARAANLITNWTQFRFRPQDNPRMWTQPEMKVWSQFRTFQFGQAKLIKEEIIRQAVRNPKRFSENLAKSLTLFPIFGAVFERGALPTSYFTGGWMEDVDIPGPFGRRPLREFAHSGLKHVLPKWAIDRRMRFTFPSKDLEDAIYKTGKSWNMPGWDRPLARFVTKYIEDMQFAGGLAMYMDAYQAVQFGESGIQNFLLGAGATDIIKGVALGKEMTGSLIQGDAKEAIEAAKEFMANNPFFVPRAFLKGHQRKPRTKDRPSRSR